jgi:circadian clock protein KaiC
MKHSNQIREFLLTNQGVELLDVYVGPEGVLTGSARLAQEAKENATQVLRQQEIQRKQLDIERKRKAMEARIALLQAEFSSEEAEAQKIIAFEESATLRLIHDREDMARTRKADATHDDKNRMI